MSALAILDRMLTAHHPHWRERRYTGLALTLLVHVALLVAWQMSRPLHMAGAGPEPARMRIQWIRLPPPPAVPVPKPKPAINPVRAAVPGAPAAPRTTSPSAPAAAPTAEPAPAAPAPAAPQPAGPQPITPQAAPSSPPSAADILKGAKRDIGKIDRDLRKENNPYIVLPPDSPQLRMRRGMEAAHDLAPPRIWEAPKIEALVNDTGDGARRERVITGNGTYCVTDRGINTSIDMIEKHGKQRITSCPQHELPASRQQWRSARD